MTGSHILDGREACRPFSGWCSQYDISSLHFPSIFHGTNWLTQPRNQGTFFFSTAKQTYDHGTSRKVCQPLTPPRIPLEVGDVKLVLHNIPTLPTRVYWLITNLECSNGIFRNLALGHPDCPMKVWASGVAAQAPEPLGSGLERKVVKDVCPI